MAQVTVTNVSPSPIHLGDLYTTIAPAQVFSFQRAASQISEMTSLIKEAAAGTLTVAVTYSTDELTSGLAFPPNLVQAEDLAAVGAAEVASAGLMLRQALVAGGGGAPDDVQIYALDAVPYKFRVLDAWALISTAVGASTLDVRTDVGGAGTLLATLDSGATGRVVMSAPNASAVVTPGASTGVFVRRSDNGVAGEVFILIRRES